MVDHNCGIHARISYEIDDIRRDFPILQTRINGIALTYLDNAATTQKPLSVINAISSFYAQECASVRRGAYYLSERATELYESSRSKVCHLINAASTREIIFVRGATEGINLVAQTFGRVHVNAGDEVLISAMEHHSNIVPWQMLCEEKGARLRVAPINSAGELELETYAKLLSPKTRLVAITQVSNVLGTINPVSEMIQLAHQQMVPVLVDAAQSAPHTPIDVQALDCDFLAFSGHKIYGPTGIGVLYGKEGRLDSMPPYQGGGDMIKSVTFEKTCYNDLPYKFEAGTPNVAGSIGLGAAIDYVQSLGIEKIAAHESDLLAYATTAVETMKGFHIIGEAKQKAGAISFIMEGVHPHDIGTILAKEGIAIRTGHHCAQPVMDFFKIPATVRASVGLYNSREDIDVLLRGLSKIKEIFR